MGYLPKKAPEFFWNSSMPVSLHADSTQNILAKLGIIFSLIKYIVYSILVRKEIKMAFRR